ncbi:hypothetical protein [Marinobacterium iners]|uniref:Uncharacterized protein n=1 Tax=Marinobacterium iners DSM 11526 TaxID=1122198 RepID=A0A1H3X722_9GAMM|nr:hypothetical protein [Marinobacterium iners]SDZ94368.1 hypothetical protein SAMN02745729_10140 [Marinobacterium iners DSM 11526]
MAIKLLNNKSIRLAMPLAVGGTTLFLQAGEGAQFPALGASDYFYLTLIEVTNGQETDWEVVKVTAVLGDELTIEREQDNTTAREWSVNTRGEARVNAGLLVELVGSQLGDVAAVLDGVLGV